MSATGMHKKIQLGSSRKKNASLFLDCFRGVIKHKEYWNKWIVDQCWIDVINERYGMSESMQFTTKELNNAIARNAGYKAAGIDTVTVANSFGIHKSSYRPREKKSQGQRVTAYYVTTPGVKPAEMPGGNSKWHTSLVSVVPSGINTRQNPMKRGLPDERPAPTKPTPAQKKRKGMKTRFQSVDKQSEKKDDGEKEALAANKTSVDIKPNQAGKGSRRECCKPFSNEGKLTHQKFLTEN
jgi:hypothetical protein